MDSRFPPEDAADTLWGLYLQSLLSATETAAIIFFNSFFVTEYELAPSLAEPHFEAADDYEDFLTLRLEEAKARRLAQDLERRG